MPGPKKWFMLQVWRIQQVSAIVTIALLALSLALQLFNYVQWRLEGTVLYNSIVGVPLLLITIGLLIWGVSIWWDLRMRMWREQAQVLVERNPYTKEKMASKEILQYVMLWLPVLETVSKDDPKIQTLTVAFKDWIRKNVKNDPGLAQDLRELLAYMGKEQEDILGFLEEE